MADLPSERDFRDFSAWSGRDVVDAEGDRVGALDLIFLDEATGVPEWALVKTDDGEAFGPRAGALGGALEPRRAAGRPGRRRAQR